VPVRLAVAGTIGALTEPTPQPQQPQPAGLPAAGIGRRALLVTGLAGLGVGGGAGYALADRSPSPVRTAGRLEYGPGPSGGDDSDALQNAVDAAPHGALLLPPGAYRLSRQLVVPAGVQLVGSGGFPPAAHAATSITLAGAAAGLHFAGGGNGARDLTVLGAGSGASPSAAALTVGGLGAGDVGADCYFANVSVVNAPGTGWLVQGVQNSTFVNCRVQSSGADGLVLDYSAGGHLFQRFESAGNAGANLRIRQSRVAARGAYAIPADNTFLACIFEQRSTPGPAVLVEAGDTTSFLHCAFASTPGRADSDTSALVEVRSGRFDFGSPVVFLQGAGRSAFGVHGASSGSQVTVAVSGLATVSGGPAAFADVDAAGALLLSGAVLGLHADTPTVPTRLLSASTPASRVFAPQLAQGSATTTLTASGPVRVDALAGARQFVLLAGHDVTGLDIAGAADGQPITLIFVQGATPGRLALPGQAAGFLWSGGDAHRPVLRSAHGYLAVELVRFAGRYWLETSRAGTDVG
jgi:hypothetical protein